MLHSQVPVFGFHQAMGYTSQYCDAGLKFLRAWSGSLAFDSYGQDKNPKGFGKATDNHIEQRSWTDFMIAHYDLRRLWQTGTFLELGEQ